MATINDVARRAAVSAATVSYVISGKSSVSERTRARVLAAIDELDYRPNLVARSLARRRTYTLGLLLPDIANPFYPEIAREVERIARTHGYHLLLCNTASEDALGQIYLQDLAGRQIDGLLAMAGGLRLPDVHAAAEEGLPVVLCNWSEEEHQPEALSTVDIDFRYGGELAMRHLGDLGHRRVGVIAHGGAAQRARHHFRIEGFRTALEAYGEELAAQYLCYGDSTMESGYRAAEKLLALRPRPTALFATNDLMAIGAMEAAGDRGLRLPADLSVVGFDDIALAGHVRPRLTTIAIPKDRLAAEAMTLLLHLIDGVDGAPAAPSHLTIRPHLVVRHSTAPPPVSMDAPVFTHERG